MDVITQVNWAGVLERLIAAGLIGGLGLVVAVRVLRERNASLREAIAQLTESCAALGRSVGDMQANIESVRRERTECELRASHTYATRAEILRMISDQTHLYHRNEDKLNSVHDRITELGNQVANLAGRIAQGRESGT